MILLHTYIYTHIHAHTPAAHFDAVGLSVFNNQWSSVHDFDRGVEGDNWSLAHSHSEPPPFAIPSSGEFAEIGVSFSHEDSVIPLTLGLKDKPAEQEVCGGSLAYTKSF